MIRSRDLVLFVGIVFFLAIGMAVTYVSDIHISSLLNTDVLLTNQNSASTTYTAVATVKENNRQANIDRLRGLLASGKQIITEDPSVESIPVIETGIATKTEDVVGVVQLKKCDSFDNGLFTMQRWPVSDTTILVKNGMRSVVHVSQSNEVSSSQNASTTASSTEVVVPPRILVSTLLFMPMYPSKVGVQKCVQSEIVGVTVSGALLSNSDAPFYRSLGSSELIGYARDGFPVYGPYGGEVDQCGGYMHPEGYRYTIGLKRDFILGCYVGTPLPFTL